MKLEPAEGLSARTGVRLRISRRSYTVNPTDDDSLRKSKGSITGQTFSAGEDGKVVHLMFLSPYSLDCGDRDADFRIFSSLIKICFRS